VVDLNSSLKVLTCASRSPKVSTRLRAAPCFKAGPTTSAAPSLLLRRANCYIRMHSIDTASLFVFSCRVTRFPWIFRLIEAVIEIPRTFGTN
jgi:hypothetical protein